MTTTTDTLDMDKVMEFVGGMVTDLGAAVVAAGVVIGHRLGLYRALAQGPTTPAELAERTGTSPRYISEWLAAQAASGYVQYDETAGTFAMTEEQAFVLTDPDGPIYLPGAYVFALGALKAEPRITEAFRSGGGMGWHEHDPDVFVGCETFFRPGYVANIVDAWLPALDGVEEKLRAGARVADIGCGHGASTVLMATAYPASTFTGSDYHDESVQIARKRAAEAGVADRTTFETASATTFSGHDLDLVTSFDCLHDMGDPVGAARHVRETLAPDGTWMVVEPAAGDTLTENLNPVGRLYYAFSALLCVPNGRSQAGGYSLGAQAGPAAIRQIATDAGFTRFRQAAATPFNLVYEVRP